MKSHFKRNRFLSMFLVFVCFFVAAAPHADSATSSVLQSGIGPACPNGTTTQTVSFVHVGDLHANFDLVKDKYSRIRAYLEKVRLENPYTIFTNAGDDYEKGSVAEQYSRGIAVKEATFAMQFDVRTIGNHDFAWGAEQLLAFSRDPHSLVLSSNTRYDGVDVQGLGSVDYGAFQVGCLRVGFFGLIGPSWNELDKETNVDYLPSLHTTYNYEEIARKIVDAHRGEVDLMVMVSHLGNYWDKLIAGSVAGIDLVLGGHSHIYPVPVPEKINNTLVVLPDFHGDGVTRVDVTVNVAATPKSVTSYSASEQPVAGLTDIDATVHQAISDILTTYAPDATQPVAYLGNLQNNSGMAAIAAKAGIKQYSADAALLDPAMANPVRTWSPGKITTQDLIDGYFIERQPSNTPGINALYLVEVSGASLKLMKGQQTGWVYSGPAAPVDAATYKVIIHKGPALNPERFFPTGLTFLSVTYLSEAWEALAAYGASRTAACLSLDTDSPPSIPACITPGSYSAWTAARFKSTTGPATLDYWDPGNTGWGASKTEFNSSANFSLPPLADGPDTDVVKFPKSGPAEGYLLTHNEPPNGAYSANGLVSNYTLVMDLLWPTASLGKFRALLQKTATNSDDADWFVGSGNGIGISGSYFSSLAANQWYRIALVARAAPTGGTLQFFVDGQFAGEVANADLRWALGPTALLFADNDNETQQGYVAGILFAGYAMSKTEVLGLGKATTSLPPVVNGACGAANGGVFTSKPLGNLCSSGTAGTVSGTGPWTWSCVGINGGGTTNSCSANIKTWTASGETGSGGAISPASRTVFHGGITTFTVTPDAGYTALVGGTCGGALNGNTYTTNAITGLCTVNVKFVLNDTCGSSNGTTLTTAPATNLCSTGTASIITGSGPWTWTCAGTNGATTATCGANIDITGPALILSTLATGAITNNAILNITGTVTDASGVTTLMANTTAVTVTNSSFSHALTLQPGTNTITAIATDTLGNKTTDTRTITLDTTAPVLTVSAPADNSTTANMTASISGTIDETSTIGITVNSGTSQTAATTGNTFSANVNLTSGINTITITATDLAGHSSSAKRTVTRDNTKPSLAITNPAQDITTSQKTFKLEGTVTDPPSTVTVGMECDGTTYTPTVTTGTFSQSITFTTAKQYSITVTATDEAGNIGTARRNIIYRPAAKGDVNGDGIIDISDALLTLQYSLDIIPHNATNDANYLANADVAPLDANNKPQGDGKIDIVDALLILQAAVNLIKLN